MDEMIFELANLEVEWNGVVDDAFIDIDLHDDNLSEDVSSIVGRITLRPDQATELANLLLAQVARVTAAEAEVLAA